MTIYPNEKLGPIYNLYFTNQRPLLSQMNSGNLPTFCLLLLVLRTITLRCLILLKNWYRYSHASKICKYDPTFYLFYQGACLKLYAHLLNICDGYDGDFLQK